MIRYRLLLPLLLLAANFSALADERILHFSADIEVHESGEMTVTELISVRAEGSRIKRGIYRDFPTHYRDRLGNRYVVEFEPLSVQRNDSAEPWHRESLSNGVRVYFGTASRQLEPGIHEYEFRYRTNRQLGFFEDHDELYWNVTGNGWAFPIDKARARVSLPFSLEARNTEIAAFTGHFLSTESAAEYRLSDDGKALFSSSRVLGPSEGLSIVVSWPKGLIQEPSATQKAAWFFHDNRAALVLLTGYLFILCWYFWAWNKVGRDPEKGVIIPRYRAPTGLSPAASRYVLSMGFRRQSFIAALISLAVKGHLSIEDEGKEFTLARETPGPDSNSSPGRKRNREPTPGERAVLDALLPEENSRIAMEQENHEYFTEARQGLSRALKKEYKGRLFHLNGIYLAPPILISVLVLALSIAFSGGPMAWILYTVLVLLTHILFGVLMRAPTPAGRQVMDEIEGFRMYLDTAEQDRLDRMRSPELTPEVFESFLPYAYALGVENNWCKRFAREVPQAAEDPSGSRYQPSWYRGNLQGLHALNHLGSDFSDSFSSAISSASTAPGSSSGSGGGGFSGGGGGGGGGGGW